MIGGLSLFLFGKELEQLMKYYVRFGRIPPDEISKSHRGDGILWSEKGVSAYESTVVNDVYFPILPDNPTEECYADYFYFLFSDKRVFLVIGDELEERGSSGEPLLKNVKAVKELTDDYDYLKAIHNRRRKRIEDRNEVI